MWCHYYWTKLAKQLQVFMPTYGIWYEILFSRYNFIRIIRCVSIQMHINSWTILGVPERFQSKIIRSSLFNDSSSISNLIIGFRFPCDRALNKTNTSSVQQKINAADKTYETYLSPYSLNISISVILVPLWI